MKECIVVTYKNGSSINIDVPELYYKEKYSKKPDKKLHQIFKKEYSNFVKAMNSSEGMVQVGKYLKFSNAIVSSREVLSIDIKNLEEEVKPLDNTIFIPGVHDKVYLDLSDTRLDNFLNKLEQLNIVENIDKLLQKLVAYFNKSNLEFTVKAGVKKKPAVSNTTTSKKASIKGNEEEIKEEAIQPQKESAEK